LDLLVNITEGMNDPYFVPSLAEQGLPLLLLILIIIILIGYELIVKD